jgi:hypothetical protein
MRAVGASVQGRLSQSVGRYMAYVRQIKIRAFSPHWRNVSITHTVPNLEGKSEKIFDTHPTVQARRDAVGQHRPGVRADLEQSTQNWRIVPVALA